MIRVTVELWPKGDESRAVVLGTMNIANDGTGTPARGNYAAHARGKRRREFRHARVEGFPRKRLLAWDLLYRVLKEMVGDRN